MSSSVVLLLIIASFLASPGWGNDVPGVVLPSRSAVDQVGQRISRDLINLINEASGREELARRYAGQIFYIEPVHGEDVLEEAIEKLEPLFQRRIKAVEGIARRAEELAMAHEYEEEPEMSRIKFVNGRDWEDPALNESALANNSHRVQQFGQLVNLNMSAVQLPMQVYEGWMWHRFKPIWYEDFDMVNTLMWSNKLDDVFLENMRKDPTLHWQYFASREGLLRYYPAHKWKTQGGQHDTFDARQRPWFTQSIASSKDLLILIDVSGSIHGPTFEILKITVKRLLGTLSQHDFFNVLQFNDSVSTLLPCADPLMPATTRNKRLIHQALDYIVPLGKASFAHALSYVHDYIVQLEDWKGENRSSNCQLAVVLISDGGTEFPLEQLEAMTNHSVTRRARLFTLAVGPHPIPTLNLRNISCSTNAFHGAILTYGAIPAKVQGYLQVLSRPLALSQDDSLIDWSLSYQDATGAGSVISITKPVFQRGGNLSQSLLGVAGVDVPMTTFDRALPNSQLGLGGYKMVVTPTGSTVIHPKLEQQLSYVEDPLVVDYEDLEPSGPWSESLRQKLVDGRKGSLPYSPITMTPDAGYAIQQKRLWFFRAIAKTAYRLAISIKDGAHIILPNLDLQGKVPWLGQVTTRAAPWIFCNQLRVNYSSGSKDAMAHYFSQLSERFERGGEDCDQTALSHLLWDLETTSNVSQSWPSPPVDQLQHRRFHSRFVLTAGGVSRVESRARPFLQDDVMDPRNSSLFRRLANAANSSIIIKPPPLSGRSFLVTDEYVVAGKVSSKDQLLAVTGAVASQEAIQTIWTKALAQLNASGEGQHIYWLDEGGYVIATNQPGVVPGSFVGSSHVDPQLMEGMLRNPGAVYDRRKMVKMGANCPIFVKQAPISSAPPLLGARWLSNLSSTLSTLSGMIYALLIGLFSTATGVSGTLQDALDLDKLRPAKVDSHLCSKEYVLYQLRSSFQTMANLNCSELCPKGATDWAIRRVMARPMPESNSILVVASPPCRCPVNPVVQHGLIHVENEMDKCQRFQRYRKSSKQCYANDPRENSLECSGHSIRGSVAVLFPSIIFTCLVLWILR